MSRDLLNRTRKKKVLKPGQAVLIESGSLVRPEIHIHALSEDQVEVRIERPGDRPGEIEVTPQVLTREEINKSRHTYRYLTGVNVSWRPSSGAVR